MTTRTALAVLLWALSVSLPAPSPARDLLVLGGMEAGAGQGGKADGYAYLGAVAPLREEKLGQGWVQRYWLDLLGYEYLRGGETIEASGFGIEAAIGYQSGGERGWGGANLGFRYSHTDLSPDDPRSEAGGEWIRVKFQAEGERRLGSGWKLEGGGSYVFGLDGFWARGRVLFRAGGKVSTGPEVVLQGDPDYRLAKLGWVVAGLEPLPKMGLGLKAGVSRTDQEETGVYFGLELSSLYQGPGSTPPAGRGAGRTPPPGRP